MTFTCWNYYSFFVCVNFGLVDVHRSFTHVRSHACSDFCCWYLRTALKWSEVVLTRPDPSWLVLTHPCNAESVASTGTHARGIFSLGARWGCEKAFSGHKLIPVLLTWCWFWSGFKGTGGKLYFNWFKDKPLHYQMLEFSNARCGMFYSLTLKEYFTLQ